jgi:hypothetical protein
MVCSFFGFNSGKGVHDGAHKNPMKDRWPKPSQGRQKRKAKQRPKDT